MFNFVKSAKVSTDESVIDEILRRGVEDVFVLENLKSKLCSGKKLRVKLGFDPTGENIHIGRASILWKLRAFQDLGHTIIFIVGDFTAQIGDPSDKLNKRPMLSPSEIKKNLKNYKKQVGKIVDISRAEFHFNSEWLQKLDFQKISELAECFSVQQMAARRNFKDRFEKGEEVSLREFLYPLLQGYDSVVVRADVEIGGFDQLFNLKAGRVIQKHYNQPEQNILTTKMLPGLDGRKMSTSWGNVVNIVDDPRDMYGKVMSLDDSLLEEYFLLCTKISLSEIKDLKEQLAGDVNPRDVKMRLAREIVTLYHGERLAADAEKNFVKTFSKKEMPDNVSEVIIKKGSLLAEVLLKHKIIKSKSDFRRLVSEKAVHNLESNTLITDPNYKIETSIFLKVGKRRFLKISAN